MRLRKKDYDTGYTLFEGFILGYAIVLLFMEVFIQRGLPLFFFAFLIAVFFIQDEIFQYLVFAFSIFYLFTISLGVAPLFNYDTYLDFFLVPMTLTGFDIRLIILLVAALLGSVYAFARIPYIYGVFFASALVEMFFLRGDILTLFYSFIISLNIIIIFFGLFYFIVRSFKKISGLIFKREIIPSE